MSPRGRDKTVSDERILVEFVLSGDPAMFTSEIAANLPVSRPTVNSRLDAMETDGLVTSKTKSGRRLWWITPDGRQHIAESIRDSISSGNGS